MSGGRTGEEDGLLTSLCPLGCQFDFSAWMPNLPPSMQLPPPTSKGQASLEGFLATLPPVNATCDVVIALWLLSKEPGDRVSVGLGTRLGQPWVREAMLFTLPDPDPTLPSHTPRSLPRETHGHWTSHKEGQMR